MSTLLLGLKIESKHPLRLTKLREKPALKLPNSHIYITQDSEGLSFEIYRNYPLHYLGNNNIPQTATVHHHTPLVQHVTSLNEAHRLINTIIRLGAALTPT